MKFKTSLIEERFKDCNDALKLIAYDIDQFCQKKYGEEITITESKTTIEEDTLVKRKHSQHREGRAIDVRVMNFMSEELQEIQRHFNTKYLWYSAISSSSGASNLILIKPDHMHIAIKPLNEEQTKKFVSEWRDHEDS